MNKVLLYSVSIIVGLLLVDYIFRIISIHCFPLFPDIYTVLIEDHLFLTQVRHESIAMPNTFEFDVGGQRYYIDYFIARLAIELILVLFLIKKKFIRDPLVCYVLVDLVGAFGNVSELLFHGYVTDYIGFSYSGKDGVLINISDILLGSKEYVFTFVLVAHLSFFLRHKYLQHRMLKN
ncbi:signal peptidase II [Cellvibrio sp.]|uniref:signal peptidase II n=1 Tax=Cellvibrio sp. TaxID=1965322 RepID=UPI00396484AC